MAVGSWQLLHPFEKQPLDAAPSTCPYTDQAKPCANAFSSARCCLRLFSAINEAVVVVVVVVCYQQVLNFNFQFIAY